jgi:outer membrane lipoprotein
VKNLIMATLAAVAVSACTTIPTQLQGEYPQVSPARVDSNTFGSTVRWGGVIIDTRNEENKTCFEILSRNLGKSMRPQLEDSTLGRFIACKDGFYDPEVFAKGREITLTGTVRTIEEHPVDDFNYRYPVLDAKDVVLWEKRKQVVVYDNPYYYPFYGSWGYPYYRYPMYGYPYYGRPPYWGRTTIQIRETVPGPSAVTRQPR